jgi:arylsulfatase A-like enzyme
VAEAAGNAEPFFASLHYTAPHWPWSAPSVEEAARGREVDVAELAEGGSPRIYGEMMRVLDAGIGRVMEAVRRADAASGRGTLVVFTSDNGGERYSKIWPFVGRKWDLLEGGLRVPQIAWWPGRIRAGQVTDQMAISMDLTATCLAAAGVAAHPDHVQRAVRQGDWKYLKVEDQEFLFDIAYDPRERGNLAGKRPDLLTELRALWKEWDRGMPPIPANLPAPMKNLYTMLW